MQNLGGRILSNRRSGMSVYMRIVMIMVLKQENFATSKDLVVKSTMFLHRNIHKYTWTSPDGKIHNQSDHVLIDRRWHSSILHVRFSGELTVILITTWWLQMLGKDWQKVNK
jgi:hypothetical protein